VHTFPCKVFLKPQTNARASGEGSLGSTLFACSFQAMIEVGGSIPGQHLCLIGLAVTSYCFDLSAAGPTPGLLMMRNARADRDRADDDVTVVDVSTFVGSIGRAAAGEGGHGAIIPPI
jgi:hypothetical protein